MCVCVRACMCARVCVQIADVLYAPCVWYVPTHESVLVHLECSSLLCVQIVRKYDDLDGKTCLTLVTFLLMVQPHFKNRLEVLKDVSAGSRRE